MGRVLADGDQRRGCRVRKLDQQLAEVRHLDHAGQRRRVGNSTLIKGGLAAAINQLKAGHGKGIAVAGSPGLVRSLLDQDLLDELVLLIHPVIAGEGRTKLFADDTPLKRLDLVSAEPTSSGVVIATYRPVQ
jgi:dihydrofolate reductase